jgi:putative ABC transport system permease protein
MYGLRDRLAAAPGIRAAGIATASPIGGGGFYLGRSMAAEGKAPIPENEVTINWTVATPGYFAALGMPIRGRDFTRDDDTTSAPVMIVNQAFAHAMFGDANPIGRRAESTRDEKVYREIIGVVPNIKYYGVRDTARALVWVPYAQRNSWHQGIITIRTEGPPEAAAGTLRSVMASVDKNIALANVMTMSDAASRSMASDRMLAVLLTAFAGLALALAAIGIFGVLSYSIEQRTHELGVRLAIGAQKRDVLLLVLAETTPLVVAGVAIGLGAGFALTRVMRAMLFEVQPTDVATFTSVAVVLTLVALVAAMVPARRAARIDPVIALRRNTWR